MTTIERILQLIKEEAQHTRCEQCAHWRPMPGQGPELRCTNTFSPYQETQTQRTFWCDRGLYQPPTP
jgi:hypothetical protein